MANVKYTLNECLDIVASSVNQGGGGSSSSGLNLEQFLSLYDYLVDNDLNVQAVWRVLRAFDVNTGLAVEDRAIMYDILCLIVVVDICTNQCLFFHPLVNKRCQERIQIKIKSC